MIKNRIISNVFNLILCLLVGICGFSSLSSLITIKILKLPFDAIEIFIIPFYFLLRKNIILFNKYVPFCIYCFVILLLLGLFLAGNEALSTARSFLLILFGFCIAYNYRSYNQKIVFSILYGVLLGELISSRLTIVSLDSQSFVTNINFVAINVLISISIFTKKVIHNILIISFCIVVSFMSITRGIVIYILFNVIISIMLSFAYNRKKSMATLLLTFFIGIFFYGLYFNIENAVENFSPTIHHRMYTKVANFGEKNNADEARANEYQYLIDHPFECIVPHGFCSTNVGKEFNNKLSLLGFTQDVSIIELIYIFGFFFIIILCKLIKLNFEFFKYYLFYRKQIYGIILSFLIMFFLYLFLGYGVINNPYSALTDGLIIGSSLNVLKIKSI